MYTAVEASILTQLFSLKFTYSNMGGPPDSSKGCHERSGVLEGTLPLSLCMDLQTSATSVMEPDVVASASLSCSEQIRAAWSIHVITALQSTRWCY